MKSQQPSHASGGPGPRDLREHDQDRLRAAGLRRVAVASVAALAAVLTFAVATAGSDHGSAHRGNAGHGATHARSLSGDD